MTPVTTATEPVLTTTPTPAPYQARPGRSVLVAGDLTELHGPVSGLVELPLWLFWCPDRTFNLDDPAMLRWMYQTVLREASRPGGSGRLPERGHAGRGMAGPVPAEGCPAGVGGALPGPARRLGHGRQPRRVVARRLYAGR